MTDNDAYQATTSATLVPLPTMTCTLFLQNLGPNDVYVAASAAKCTSAKGMKIAANGGVLQLFPINTDTLYIIAVTAAQVSPADTRWYALGPGYGLT